MKIKKQTVATPQKGETWIHPTRGPLVIKFNNGKQCQTVGLLTKRPFTALTAEFTARINLPLKEAERMFNDMEKVK